MSFQIFHCYPLPGLFLALFQVNIIWQLSGFQSFQPISKQIEGSSDSDQSDRDLFQSLAQPLNQ